MATAGTGARHPLGEQSCEAWTMKHGPLSHPAVIFDVDGVLVESPHERAWQVSLERLMADRWRDAARASSYAPQRFTTAVYQQYVAGKPRESGALAALEYFAVPDAAVRAREYAQFKQAMIEALIAEGAFSAFPDALRFIVALQQRHVPMAAASSSKNANTMMAEIDLAAAGGGDMRLLQVFGANVCGRDVERGKPFPDLFLLSAHELGVVPGDCVVVEDAPAGILAAKAGGMHAIGVARLDDAQILRKANADLVVTSLDAVAVSPLAEGRLELEGTTASRR